jgi:hypothetical protein
VLTGSPWCTHARRPYGGRGGPCEGVPAHARDGEPRRQASYSPWGHGAMEGMSLIHLLSCRPQSVGKHLTSSTPMPLTGSPAVVHGAGAVLAAAVGVAGPLGACSAVGVGHWWWAGRVGPPPWAGGVTRRPSAPLRSRDGLVPRSAWVRSPLHPCSLGRHDP